ncbi:MAG: electron transfer flavoprotein subunit beta/FixA family protein [Acidobacteriota bacterium]
MNIIVCLKQVFATDARIKIAPDGKTVSEEQIEWIMSPYDEFALEEALRIREAKSGKITALTLGPERCTTMLRSAFALGVDAAVHLKDPLFDNLDALAVARVLAEAIRKIPHDLVLFGKQGVGVDQGLVQSMVAELLGLPLANIVTKLSVEADKVRCLREVDGGSEWVECGLPAIVSAQKGLNDPRIANLKGIMAAKKKPIDVWNAQSLGVTADSIGASTLTHDSYVLPPPRKAGKVLQGTAEDTAQQLVSLLRNEAKII